MIDTKTPVKNFNLTEIYGFYDRPLFFACRNESNLFFALCVDGDDSDFTETWLYASASAPRIESVKKGETELRHIFTDAEDGFVYQVEIALGYETPTSVSEVKCNEIPDKYLPEFGEYARSHPLTNLLEYPQR